MLSEPARGEEASGGRISSHGRWEGVPLLAHTPHHGREPYSCPLKVAVPACPLKGGRLGSVELLRGWGPWGGEVGQLTREEEPELPRRLSGMPFSTSSRVLAVRYMHMPRPNSKKWMFHDSSFIFSLAWGSRKQGVCGADPDATSTSPPRAGVVLRTAPPSASLGPRGRL